MVQRLHREEVQCRAERQALAHSFIHCFFNSAPSGADPVSLPKTHPPMQSQPSIPRTRAHPLLHNSHVSISSLTLLPHPFLPPYLSPLCTAGMQMLSCVLCALCSLPYGRKQPLQAKTAKQPSGHSFLPLTILRKAAAGVGGAAKQGGQHGSHSSWAVPLENNSDPTQKQQSVRYKPVLPGQAQSSPLA